MIDKSQQSAATLLTEQQAADLLKFSTRTLQAWRHRGGGPAFVKISSKAVRYRITDLIKWADSLVKMNTV